MNSFAAERSAPPLTLGKFALRVAQDLEAGGAECADPVHHALLLLEFESGRSQSQLAAAWSDTVSENTIAAVNKLVERRVAGEPWQYIIGETHFWKRDFALAPGCLIPRPETERVVEVALECLPTGPLSICEIGAGSGIIGISLLLERPEWKWTGYEISTDAARIAKRNIDRHDLADRYELKCQDFFLGAVGKEFDWLVANPPYVPSAEIAALSREVRSEPKAALDGGVDGLDFYRRIAESSSRFLRPEGGIVLEIGSNQGDQLKSLFADYGFANLAVLGGLCGRDRVLLGAYKGR